MSLWLHWHNMTMNWNLIKIIMFCWLMPRADSVIVEPCLSAAELRWHLRLIKSITPKFFGSYIWCCSHMQTLGFNIKFILSYITKLVKCCFLSPSLLPFGFSHALTGCGICRELNVSYFMSAHIALFNENGFPYFNYLSQSCLYIIGIKKPNLNSYSHFDVIYVTVMASC